MSGQLRFSMPLQVPVRVTVLAALDVAAGMDGMMIDFATLINDARATGRTQALIKGLRTDLERDQGIVAILQKAFDDMAFDDERFTVSKPRLLGHQSARIDIAWTGPGSASDAEEDLSDDLTVLDDDLMRVLTESLKDFLRRARLHSNYSTHICGRIVRVLGEKGITHVWHICEHGLRTAMGQRLIPELTDWATESLETMLKEENVSGIRRFSRSDRRQLVRRSRDYM